MKIRLVLFLSVCFLYVSGQNSSTSSNEFYVVFMENLNLTFNGPPQFNLYFSSETSGTATITAPATGFTEEFEYVGGQISEYFFPAALFYAEGSEEIEDLGLRINTETDVQIFAMHYRAFFSDATLLLPTSILGSEYLVAGATDFLDFLDSPSSFAIVATEDNTVIDITPKALTLGLKPANVSFQIVLNAGQSYQVQALGDLTGSLVKSLNGEKIAVFGGARKANIVCSGADNHVYDQLYPIEYAGNEFILIPFEGQGNSLYKIVATEDNTEIKLGTSPLITLNRGEFTELISDKPEKLISDKGVLVSQFNPSQTCTESFSGDPTMLQLCPADYRLKKTRIANLTGFSGSIEAFNRNLLTVFTENENTSTVSVDGEGINWQSFPPDDNYSYAYVNLVPGESDLIAENGVQAYTYGFGFYDAYSYHLGFDRKIDTQLKNFTLDENVRIYPNPANDIIQLVSDSQVEEVSIYSIQGTLVLQKTDFPTNINISELPEGMYIIHVLTNRGMALEKFQKLN